jgi:prevent-host-death family protein
MKKTNALAMRQNLGNLLNHLKKTGEPILIEKNREPAAVLISLDDYKKRFVDLDADDKRKTLVDTIKQQNLSLPKGVSSLDLIRELRS